MYLPSCLTLALPQAQRMFIHIKLTGFCGKYHRCPHFLYISEQICSEYIQKYCGECPTIEIILGCIHWKALDTRCWAFSLTRRHRGACLRFWRTIPWTIFYCRTFWRDFLISCIWPLIANGRFGIWFGHGHLLRRNRVQGRSNGNLWRADSSASGNVGPGGNRPFRGEGKNDPA